MNETVVLKAIFDEKKNWMHKIHSQSGRKWPETRGRQTSGGDPLEKGK